MGGLNSQVIQNLQNLTADVFKSISVVGLPGIWRALRFPVATQIDHQNIEMLLEFSGLLKPNRRASTSSVHKNNPILLPVQLMYSVMQHDVCAPVGIQVHSIKLKRSLSYFETRGSALKSFQLLLNVQKKEAH